MLTNAEIHQRLNDLAQLISQNECERKRLNRENEHLRAELTQKNASLLKLRRFIHMKLLPHQVQPEPTVRIGESDPCEPSLRSVNDDQ
jgi:hypothetical protein